MADKRYHWVQHCLKLFIGAENDPDRAEPKGRRREERGVCVCVCEGAGGRNTNETGEKEKYWADVMLQMLNAQVHVRGSEWGAAVELKVNSRERSGNRLRGGWRQTHKSPRCNPKHWAHVILIEREILREARTRWRQSSWRQSKGFSQWQFKNICMQTHSLGNLYTSQNLKNNTLKCCIFH